MPTLKKADVYVGGSQHIMPTNGYICWVYGDETGPLLLAVDAPVYDVVNEADERFGIRVDLDDAALRDYPGRTPQDCLEHAIADGDVRVNDGGTTVWVNPYEWIRGFRTPREAGRFFRTGRG